MNKNWPDAVITSYSPSMIRELEALYLLTRKTTFTWLNTEPFCLQDFSKDTEGEQITIAMVEGKVAGFISVWEPDNFIHHLYVSPELKGRGIGTLLLSSVTATHRQLSLKCMVKNLQATEFYKQNGFDIKSEADDGSGAYYLMSWGLGKARVFSR